MVDHDIDVVLGVIDAGHAALSAPELYDDVLGAIRSLARADVAAVITATPDGPTVVSQDGLEVPGYLVGPDVLGAITAPGEAWQGLGVTAVLVEQLPGHSGHLVVGWTDARVGAERSESRPFRSAVATVLSALDRIETATRFADLTKRVQSAQQLAAMGDYDWHIASDTNQWSDQLYRIYGYEPQSFNASYERFLANIHPDDRERIQAVHQQAYATGEPYSMIERIVRPDGDVRYLSSNGEVIMDEAGTPIRMRGTCVDVTERILAERERERISERFRGLVEASPEAILVIGAEGVVVQANPRAGALLGGDPTGHLITEFLLRKAVSGQGLPAVRLDGSDLILDIVQVELSEADRGGRKAIFLTDAKPRLEREAMAQRLGELHQRRRQALELNDSVVQGLAAVSYALEDADAAAARSFLDRTLASARSMMDDLLEPSAGDLVPGDLVRVEPANLATPQGPEAEVHDISSKVPPPVPRVLIVDDSSDLRTLLRLQLAKFGSFEVVGEAVDGLDAVEQAKILQPDLVLLDMAMPRMDGLQALPLIREVAPGARVIVLSGFNQATLEDAAIAAGANRYVTKGGKLPDLIAAMTSVLGAA